MNKYFKGYITRENAVKVMCRETCHPGVRCPDTYCVEMWDKFKDIPNEDVRPVRKGKRNRYAGDERMSGKNDIKVVTDLKPKDTRACEICGRLTDRIDMHICSYCRHALALIIREWEVEAP